MPMKLKELIKTWMPLKGETKRNFDALEVYLFEEDVKKARTLLKLEKAGIVFSSLDYSAELTELTNFPMLQAATTDKKVLSAVESINKAVMDKIKTSILRKLDKDPWKVVGFLAPNLVGFETVKQCVLLQLISNDPVHILLLGDPGVGKTDILHDASDISPISSFGQGSGVSGAGLSATYKGNKLLKGLLPLADKGLCAIDELNLVKEQDYTSLYNAMEKGFVAYSKGGKHTRLSAHVSVLATANPKGDRFMGTTIPTLKKQLPFEPALLSRFHLVFFIRRPGTEEFKRISKQLVAGKKKRLSKGDKDILKEWIDRKRDQHVTFPARLKDQVGKLAEDLKKGEKNYLIEVSPRVIIGVMRLAQSVAKMEKRETVHSDDLLKAEGLLFKSLKIK